MPISVWHHANKWTNIKAKDSKGVFKVRKMEEQSEIKAED